MHTLRKSHSAGSALLISFTAAVASGLLAGCGGSHSTAVGPTTGPAGYADSGRATFVIHWPAARGSRADEPNAVFVFVNGPGIKETIAAIVPRVSGQATASVTLEVPVGPKRLFSAEARLIPISLAGPVMNPSRPDLLQGTIIATGSDLSPHDVAFNQNVNVAIQLTTSTTDPTVTSVAVVVNQVVTDDFPMCLVLQIIRDQNGDPITNLTRANFDVSEDGQPAVVSDVRVVTQAQTNSSIVLVLDRSGSMDGQPTADLDQAAKTFVGLLGAGDRAAIINFDDTVQLMQDFTDDKQALDNAIDQTWGGGSTALYDAVGSGIDKAAASGGRVAVIAMTDGRENASQSHTLTSVTAFAAQKGVPVFTIGLGSADTSALRQLANDTGGLFFQAPSSNDLNQLYTKISQQLAAQVQIWFESPDPTPSGRDRQLTVKFTYGSLTGTSTFTYRY